MFHHLPYFIGFCFGSRSAVIDSWEMKCVAVRECLWICVCRCKERKQFYSIFMSSWKIEFGREKLKMQLYERKTSTSIQFSSSTSFRSKRISQWKWTMASEWNEQSLIKIVLDSRLKNFNNRQIKMQLNFSLFAFIGNYLVVGTGNLQTKQ